MHLLSEALRSILTKGGLAEQLAMVPNHVLAAVVFMHDADVCSGSLACCCLQTLLLQIMGHKIQLRAPYVTPLNMLQVREWTPFLNMRNAKQRGSSCSAAH
jgi:hypothetical protein